MRADAEEVSRGWWKSWGDLVIFMLAMAFLLVSVFTAPGILASSHPVRSYVLIVGVIAEIAGLTMALIGLYETWHNNAPGRSRYPWLVRLWARLRRRPQVVQVHAVDHPGIAESATIYVGGAVGKVGDSSLQEQVDQIREELAALAQMANDNSQAITTERAERLGAMEAVRREMFEGGTRVESRAVKLTVDGIPLAVTGLGVTIVGVLLQALAQGLPS